MMFVLFPPMLFLFLRGSFYISFSFRGEIAPVKPMYFRPFIGAPCHSIYNDRLGANLLESSTHMDDVEDIGHIWMWRYWQLLLKAYLCFAVGGGHRRPLKFAAWYEHGRGIEVCHGLPYPSSWTRQWCSKGCLQVFEDDESKTKAVQLYAILTGLLKGKPLRLLRQQDDRNGLEVYRQLCQLYTPQSKTDKIILVSKRLVTPIYKPFRPFRKGSHNLTQGTY